MRSTPAGGAVRALEWSCKGHLLAFTVDDKEVAAVRMMHGVVTVS
jgi:hypothetical protein